MMITLALLAGMAGSPPPWDKYLAPPTLDAVIGVPAKPLCLVVTWTNEMGLDDEFEGGEDGHVFTPEDLALCSGLLIWSMVPPPATATSVDTAAFKTWYDAVTTQKVPLGAAELQGSPVTVTVPGFPPATLVHLCVLLQGPNGIVSAPSWPLKTAQTVLDSSGPGPVSDLHVVSATVSLAWTPPSDDGSDAGYHLHYSKADPMAPPFNGELDLWFDMAAAWHDPPVPSGGSVETWPIPAELIDLAPLYVAIQAKDEVGNAGGLAGGSFALVILQADLPGEEGQGGGSCAAQGGGGLLLFVLLLIPACIRNR